MMRAVADQQECCGKTLRTSRARTRDRAIGGQVRGSDHDQREHSMGAAAGGRSLLACYLHGGPEPDLHAGGGRAHLQVPGTRRTTSACSATTLGRASARGPINLADRLSAPKSDPRASRRDCRSLHEPAVRGCRHRRQGGGLISTKPDRPGTRDFQRCRRRQPGQQADGLEAWATGAGELIGAEEHRCRTWSAGAGPLITIPAGCCKARPPATRSVSRRHLGPPSIPGRAQLHANAGRQAGE